MQAAGDPILVGCLYDFPQPDGGAAFEEAVRLGLADVAGAGCFDRPVELVGRHARGLPLGTAKAVEDAFVELDRAGVLVVLGPSISDNGLYVRDLAGAARLPCINYTGGERTRGEWMFHYQVGSLEEEPALLARHLTARGLTTVAVVYDDSPVGRGYADWFDAARGSLGLEVTGRAGVSALGDDLAPVVERLRAGGPEGLVYLGLGLGARALALAMAGAGWALPVVANSALMFGYREREWRAGWEGWVYVDTISDGNGVRAALRERSKRAAAGPVGVAAYDLGRLLGEGIARSGHLTRGGVREGLERTKQLPAASGADGTLMGFGQWDRAALKGHFLVLRCWQGGRSVEC